MSLPPTADVFNVISARLMAVSDPVAALCLRADELHCQDEFRTFVEAWAATAKAWEAYLEADQARVEAMAPRVDVPNAGPIRPIH